MDTIKKLFLAAALTVAAGSNAFSQNTGTTTDQSTGQSLALKVKGVTCANDLKTIADNVLKIKGVSVCETGKAAAVSSFKIVFDPSQTNEKDIRSAIENTGGCENPNDRPYKVKSK